ncbi:MAG: hypothetical protein RBR38_10385 [Desulfomicrobium apsheronum]|nr:hypothetical protein [Desulfomicrobium apsheronum]
MRRPDVFTLDYGHPLAQGLVLAGLAGLQPGFIDSSKLSNHSISGDVTKKFDEESGRYRYVVPGLSAASVTLANASDDYRLQSSMPIAFAFWARLPYNNTSIVDGFIKHGVWNEKNGGWWLGYERESVTYYRRRVCFKSYMRSFYQSGYFTENTLHHYYLESSNSGWKIYTDGYLDSSGTNGSHVSSTFSYAPVLFNCSVSSELSDILLFRRALSPAEIAILADRTDPMLGGLIVEERPVLWFDMGGSTTDNLPSANGVTTTATLSSPVLGQIHVLGGDGVAITPTLGNPTLGELADHLAGADGVVTTATLGSPVLGQVHVLTAQGITTTALLGAPTLSQVDPNAVELAADGITVVGTLGSPAIGQAHALAASGITVTAKMGHPGDEKRGGSGASASASTSKRKKKVRKEPVVIDTPRETERERVEAIAKFFDVQPEPAKDAQQAPADSPALTPSVDPAPFQLSPQFVAQQSVIEPLLIRGIQDLIGQEMQQSIPMAQSEAQRMAEQQQIAMMRMRDEDEAESLIMIFASV